MTGVKSLLEDARDSIGAAIEEVAELERSRTRAQVALADMKDDLSNAGHTIEHAAQALRRVWMAEKDQDRADALYPILQRLEGELSRMPYDP